MIDFVLDVEAHNELEDLWKVLNEQFLNNKQKILDFPPSRSIYRVLKNYVSYDLSGDFLSDVAFDMTAIDERKSTYNLIILLSYS